MKLSGFLMGGLLGMAATVYLSRKRPGAVSWAANAVTDMCSSVARKSMNKIISKDLKEEAAAFAPKPSDDTAGKSEAAWAQIETIVNSDPSVKKEAEKIKAESSSLAH
ncbi:hypothetical protein KP806_05250 [Paenibacillus sp. N4]|uniref:hypothetical protein n=1 Tax=Paenibacillus vietnamensis TaxID=2590547 RepID=UPI001CD049EA|nr:hypothetical protein [Paenibacillus vietnamensis]MCA0754447.1 hypothetical protein [Paenibacillus vietnamensis]